VEALHEPTRAGLLVGLDARQRVPAGFMVRTRDLGIEEAPHETPATEPFEAVGLHPGARPAPPSLGDLMQFHHLPIAASSRH